MTEELYVSTDIEADGPIPGPNSMLSLASAVYTADGVLNETFSVNLETLPGATTDPKTDAWWRQHPKAWDACRQECQPPEQAMRDYLNWLRALPGKPVFVAYPAAFDFMFVYWYLIRFTGESPFAQSALDIESYAMALLGRDFRDCKKAKLPERWLEDLPHTHIALDDAIEQGAWFCNMLRERRQG
ncbi:hypothetical protein [Marinobacter sp.]|uniref:hypothetical protein n=1 Tax=Marinobacter sp. TaxID=50741 RepID=UPI003850F104